MIPGQMRPHFARNDRLIRRVFVALVVLAFVVTFVGQKSTGSWSPWYFVFLILLVLVYQTSIVIRMRNIRIVEARLAERFPSDRFMVGNVRFVDASNRGPEAVGYQTVIVQFSKNALALWNPDRGTEAFFAMPLSDLDVDVTKSNPPRWAIIAPATEDATYLSIWRVRGLAPEPPDQMRRMANDLFPGVDLPVPPAPPPPRIGF